MCGKSHDFSRGLKKKRLSMGQRTWTHNLGDFCRRQDPGPHPQSWTKHNNLYSTSSKKKPQYFSNGLSKKKKKKNFSNGPLPFCIYLDMWCAVTDS